MTTGPPALIARPMLPSVPTGAAGSLTAAIPDLLEAWVRRRASAHTQRAYRSDILTFLRYLGLSWPQEAALLLTVTVPQVQAYRSWLVERGAAPKTLNRRICSLSGFFQYLGACAAELRLPVIVPNPAHAQFIGRAASDPVRETRALVVSEARLLLSYVVGESFEAQRDRALLTTFLYTGIRLQTACSLRVEDVAPGAGGATLRLREKGSRYRTIGLHAQAAAAIEAYRRRAGLTEGPLFRPWRDARRESLAARPMSPVTMWALLRGYLDRLPGAQAGGAYTPHSLRATTATLLLEAGVELAKVQELLGHRHITTTQIYDKRRRGTAEGASHAVPL